MKITCFRISSIDLDFTEPEVVLPHNNYTCAGKVAAFIFAKTYAPPGYTGKRHRYTTVKCKPIALSFMQEVVSHHTKKLERVKELWAKRESK